MSAIPCNNLLLSELINYHEIYSILEKAMYKDFDKKNSDTFLAQIFNLSRVIYKIRLKSWNTKYSQKVTCICAYHILLEGPITAALFKKDVYTFTSCTDVISYIAQLIVHRPVGTLS